MRRLLVSVLLLAASPAASAVVLIEEPLLDTPKDIRSNAMTQMALATLPEPATWATLAMSFAVIGGTVRRRRNMQVGA